MKFNEKVVNSNAFLLSVCLSFSALLLLVDAVKGIWIVKMFGLSFISKDFFLVTTEGRKSM